MKANYAALLSRDESALTNVIHSALEIKKAYIEEDEFDQGRRNLLNFGHDFGHAIEAATNYNLSHGLAVVAGIILANHVATIRGLLSEEKELSFKQDLLWPLIKTAIGHNKLNPVKIIEAMRQDKKRTGAGLALVMLKNDGSLVLVGDLTDNEARAAIEHFSKD